MLTSVTSMPEPAGVKGGGEDAARKLLEGSDPQSLPHDELLAAVEALAAHKSSQAADALQRISQPKDAAKSARRALFRLQSQGIKPSPQPQAVDAPAAERQPAK